jgi:hypothetical protein
MARTAVRSSGRRPGRAEHLASVLAELPLSALRAVDHCFAGDPVSEIKSPLLAGSRRAPALGAGEVERDRPGLRSRHPPVVLALSTGPIWLVVDVLHSHVLGSGLLLQGAPDLGAADKLRSFLLGRGVSVADPSSQGSTVAESPVAKRSPLARLEQRQPETDPVNRFIQEQLRARGLYEVGAVEAAAWLDQAAVLRDSEPRGP